MRRRKSLQLKNLILKLQLSLKRIRDLLLRNKKQLQLQLKRPSSRIRNKLLRLKKLTLAKLFFSLKTFTLMRTAKLYLPKELQSPKLVMLLKKL